MPKNSSGKALVTAVALLLVASLSISTTFGLMITKTDSIINTFAPELSSDLVIQKQVSHPFGNGYTLPDLSFDFIVSLGETYANQTLGEVTADENGSFSIKLGHGERFVLDDLREGTVVTVTEENLPSGFTVKDGEVKTYTIGTDKGTVCFDNIYTPASAPVNLSVVGTKLLEGRDWQEGDTFEFLLEYGLATESGVAWTIADDALVEYDSEDESFDQFEFDLSSVELNSAGTYSFRVSEIEGDIEGILYAQPAEFDVVVGDADMDGSLEIQEIKTYQNTDSTYNKEEGQFMVDTTLCNRYSPNGEAVVNILIEKLIDGGKLPEGYTFELYDAGGDLILTTDPTTAAGEASISLSYDTSDLARCNFRYLLKESNAGETIDGVAYDDTEYPLMVTVLDNLDGGIDAFVYEFDWRDDDFYFESNEEDPYAYIAEYASDTLVLSFQNRYKAEETSVTFSGIKLLNGRELRTDDEFAFKLYQTDADFEIVDSPIAIVPNILMRNTATDVLEGEFHFADIPELTFTEAGEYYFIVKEDASKKIPGIIYDNSEYFITVSVLDENGQLNADVVIKNQQGKAVDEIVFTNTYHPSGIAYYLQGEKILNGAELKDGMFSFEMYYADENYESIGKALKTTTNSAKGRFTFEEHFDEEGIYHYVIKENAESPMEGMTYDETVYGVTVTVSDNGEGELTASEYFCIVGGGSVNEIVFTNTYTSSVEPPTDDEDKPGDDTKPDDTEPTDPSAPSDPSKPSDPDKDMPFTGDDRHPVLYAALLCSSMTILIILLVLPKLKKKRHS